MRAEESLQQGKEFSESITETAQVIMLLLDTKGRIVRFNPYMEEISGYRLEEVKGKDWFSLFLPGNNHDHIRELFQGAISDIQTRGNINPIVTKDGQEHLVEWYDKALRDVEGNVIGLHAIGHDVTARLQAEEKVKTSLKEKEVLLAEVHHRVKNNLQIISSFLDMRIMRTDNQQVSDLFEDARSKIHTMSIIHSQLYESEQFGRIEMKRHITELIGYLSQVYAGEKRIDIVVEANYVFLSLNHAIPCALVINELVSNAFKHAFKGRGEGNIEISMEKAKGRKFILTVKNDGVGIPEDTEDTDIFNTSTLGLKLVTNTIEGQLQGKMRVERDAGTTIIAEFKIVDVWEETRHA